jgi:hypothetical protein
MSENHSAILMNMDPELQEALRKLAAEEGLSVEALCIKVLSDFASCGGNLEIRAEVLEAFEASSKEFADLYKGLA